jgi:NAD(P)H dehydrogenase (quinone)
VFPWAKWWRGPPPRPTARAPPPPPTAKVADLAARGAVTRAVDYEQPETLAAAFARVKTLVLVSSNAIGQRAPQHKAVIAAAKAAGVGRVLYTSLLHADTSPLALCEEHVETERALAESGLAYTILRNGWYTENYLAGVAAALEHGVVLGAAGEGRIASATRADYAAAAVEAALRDDPSGTVYELAGDESYTLAELAAEIARQSGKPVVYKDLPQADYAAALVGFGLPQGFADLLADSDAGAAKGGLFDDSKALSRLTGLPTTPLAAAVAKALG